MTKPTREEVETFIAVLPKLSVQMIEEDWVLALAKAYLAQDQELEKERDKAKKLHGICVFSEQTTTILLEQTRELQAENQALKAKLLILEA